MWNKLFNKNKTSRSKSTTAITTLSTLGPSSTVKPFSAGASSLSTKTPPLNDDIKAIKKKKKLSSVFSGLTLRRRVHKGRDRAQSDHILSILETPTHLLRYESDVIRDKSTVRISLVGSGKTSPTIMVDDDRFLIIEGMLGYNSWEGYTEGCFIFRNLYMFVCMCV